MPQKNTPRAAVTGAAAGMLFMAFFGMSWAGIGIGGLQGWGASWLWIPSLLISCMLLIGGIALITQSRSLSNAMTEADARYRKRTGKWFGIIFGLEGAMIGIASGICGATDHFDAFFPVMALIVGAHFFPLARLFRIRIHYLAGALLCSLAGTILLTMPARVAWGEHEIVTWWVFVGFGSALILWVTGAAVWLAGRGMLRQARKDASRI
ncbi:hypothetical protein [Paenibacillus glycinis]|uniref:Uncharacterized protein n=1 Tax=Paenibacillus glycinis TaxID=2697035 RepID=A0ABW9XXK0_9BACL|nr:hypothetical protein [Paenibacillus glycinis]NBD27364.1 hypothetical protein [Paenibacillus glycinis]